jgi:hypothetical protein
MLGSHLEVGMICTDTKCEFHCTWPRMQSKAATSFRWNTQGAGRAGSKPTPLCQPLSLGRVNSFKLATTSASGPLAHSRDFIHVSDEIGAETCRSLLAGRVLDRVRDRIPHQTSRQLVNAIRRACVGLREMCDAQREALATAGHQMDAQRFAVEDVLIEELESWFQ